MPIRLASHLYRNRHGWFYFRLIVPHDLRPHLQQCDVRFSLNTEQRQEAIILALPLIAALPQLLSDLRRMAGDKDTPAPDYFQRWLEEKKRTITLAVRVEELEARLQDAEDKLTQSVPRANAQRVVKAAHVQGQLRGKRELEERLIFPWLPEKTATFSELLAAYLRSFDYRPEGGAKKPITPKTLESYTKDIGFFVNVMGELRIGEIDRDVAGAYFQTLRKLPPNLSRLAKYRGKTIPEILAMNDPPQSPENASKKMERVSFMFNWALEEKRKWGIDANPFEGFGQSADNESLRRPFSPDELRAIFGHSDFTAEKFFTSYAFWLIPLAIYTGARLGELAQLDLKDFIEVEGIPCVDINDTDAVEVITDVGGRRKRVKNRNAKRLVPIHPELIRIGILRHVANLRGRGEQRLFPELSRTRRDGPAHAASNWFQRFRKAVGLSGKQETVFHSFRHLFITTLLDAGTAPHLIAPIVGHEGKLVTDTVYWNKRDATKRLPTVEAFTLPDDLAQLIPTIEKITFARTPGPRRNNARKPTHDATDTSK